MLDGKSTNHPLVSVVIPTCNRSGLLQRAIASVLQQTYQHLEVIVVDDASTDDTRKVVESFNDRRIRYVHHATNRGGAATRNTGIKAATGKYIAFLDDDDEWERNKTELQLAALEKYDAVLCMSTIGGERNIERLAARRTCDVQELREWMPPVGGTSALMARAELVKAVLFDESLPRCQDWDILIRLAQCRTIGYLPKRLVKYNEGNHLRITNAGTRGDLAARELEKRLLFFEKHRTFFGEKWYKRHVTRALLYGLRHQDHRIHRLLDTARRFGLAPVLRALSRRVYQKVTGNA
jgi:glycosyltransferase involved in cell wall biosynthesis